MMDIDGQFCNLCKRHCPMDKLQCSKGQNYFADNDGSFDSSVFKEERNMRDWDMENRNRQDNEKENIDIKDNNRKDNNRKDSNPEDSSLGGVNLQGGNSTDNISEDRTPEDLMQVLHRCSHFLHHRKGGGRGQQKILTILSENPDISQKELQDQLGIEPGSMSELVIKLEHKGLITRRKDETDKRMTRLLITDLGLGLSRELEKQASREDQLVAEYLSAEDQEQLKKLLSKLLKGWEETYGTQLMGRRCHHGMEHEGEIGRHCGHHRREEHREEHHGHHGREEHHEEHHGHHRREEQRDSDGRSSKNQRE